MKYLTIAKNGLLSMIAYRANFFISFFSRAIQLGLAFFMWSAIYHQSEETVIKGYTQLEMFQYLLLTAILSFVFTFSPIFKLADNIKSGQLNTLLLRPININLESLANFIGGGLPFIFTLIIIILFLKLEVLWFFLIIIYLILSLLLWHELMFIVGTLAFWVVQMWPLKPIINSFYQFLGGLLFPLGVLSTALYEVLRFSPISLVSNNFVELLLIEKTNYNLFFYYLLALIIWLIILKLFSTYLFRKGVAKFEGVGI